MASCFAVISLMPIHNFGYQLNLEEKRMAKKNDVKMAAANDKPETTEGQEPFNADLKKGVESVMSKIKERKKKLPNVVGTDERRSVKVKYTFTKPEIEKIGKDLAQRQIELVEVEDEKKSVMASFTDRIKAKKIDINRFSRHMHDGYEQRDHNCTLILDFKKREKRWKDVDAKKIVKIESFGPGDDQRRFL